MAQGIQLGDLRKADQPTIDSLHAYVRKVQEEIGESNAAEFLNSNQQFRGILKMIRQGMHLEIVMEWFSEQDNLSQRKFKEQLRELEESFNWTELCKLLFQTKDSDRQSEILTILSKNGQYLWLRYIVTNSTSNLHLNIYKTLIATNNWGLIFNTVPLVGLTPEVEDIIREGLLDLDIEVQWQYIKKALEERKISSDTHNHLIAELIEKFLTPETWHALAFIIESGSKIRDDIHRQLVKSTLALNTSYYAEMYLKQKTLKHLHFEIAEMLIESGKIVTLENALKDNRLDRSTAARIQEYLSEFAA